MLHLPPEADPLQTAAPHRLLPRGGEEGPPGGRPPQERGGLQQQEGQQPRLRLLRRERAEAKERRLLRRQPLRLWRGGRQRRRQRLLRRPLQLLPRRGQRPRRRRPRPQPQQLQPLLRLDGILEEVCVAYRLQNREEDYSKLALARIGKSVSHRLVLFKWFPLNTYHGRRTCGGTPLGLKQKGKREVGDQNFDVVAASNKNEVHF